MLMLQPFGTVEPKLPNIDNFYLHCVQLWIELDILVFLNVPKKRFGKPILLGLGKNSLQL